MNDSLFIGIDVGGTLIKIGFCDEDGNILYFSESETPVTNPQQFVNYIGYLCEVAIKDSGIKQDSFLGCGIGFPGLVDPVTGIVSKAPNIPGWKPVNVAKSLEKWLKLPVVIGNDANLAVFAECIWGNAVDRDYVLGITLGTGVGGGIVIDRQIYTGSRHMAGEIGHITVNPDGPRCTCGKRGCLEAYAGTRGLIGIAKELMKVQRGSLLWKAEDITPETISQAASSEDNTAQEAIDTMSRYLAIALSSASELLNPEIIIIGGGVSRMGQLLLNPLTRNMKRMRMITSIPQIVQSKHVEKSGVLGACALAMLQQN